MKKRIIRYLDENSTPDEKTGLLAWLKESPEHRTYFLQVYNCWISSNLPTLKVDKEKALMNFIGRVEAYELRQVRKKRNIRRWIAASAAAVLLLAVSLSLFLSEWNRSEEYYAHTIEAQRKEMLVLPDQSVVWLSPGARLMYPEQFNKDVRKVKFEGEAFFEVAKKEDQSFVVDLGEEEISVLGTSFHVKNVVDEELNEIVLVDGSIALNFRDSDQELILSPNEKLSYSKKEKQVVIETIDASFYSVKTKERLSFDNESLAYVIKCLEIWYGRTIHAPEGAGNIYVSFTVIDETLEQTMKMLSMVAPVAYRISDDEVYLSRNN